jgi:hypothetical protein
VHDKKAEWIWGVPAELEAAGLVVLADKGYQGSAYAKPPYKGKNKPQSQKDGSKSTRAASLTRRASERPAQDLADPTEAPLLPLARRTARQGDSRIAAPRGITRMEKVHCIDELYFHIADPVDEASHRLALETLVEACVIASAVSKELNYLDLAYLAAQRAEEAAELLGDPIQKDKAAFMWLLTLPRAGSWDRNLLAAEQAANALEHVLGMLALTASHPAPA